jgi:VWFA-related protein
MIRNRSILLLPLVALALAVVAAVPAATQSGTDKTLYLSVVDDAGKPVKDMTAADLRIREDGVDGDVLALKPATGPLFISLLADTTPGTESYVNDIRKAYSAFVRRVFSANPEAEVALMEFGQAAVTITNFTKSAEDLDKGINTIFPKPRSGSVLLEAIIASAYDLAKRQSRRRAVVSLNMEPSDEQSHQDAKKLDDALRRSGIQVWALSLQKGPAANSKRDVVLNELAKRTGGQRDIIVAQSAIETYLNRYADALTSQYELTYRVGGAKKVAQVVQTGTTRPGVKVHAGLYPLQQR